MNSSISIFLTRKFWTGFLVIAAINLALLYAFRNASVSWLFPPPPPKTAEWPTNLPPFSSGVASDGTPYVILPTRQLTAQELAAWSQLQEQQQKQQSTKQ